jgi:hypothetical protein
MTDTDTRAAQADIAAALLAIGKQLDRASLALTACALLALLIAPLASFPRLGLLLTVIAGLGECVFASRTAFDCYIFSTWARRWQQPAAKPEATLGAFDHALAAAGLRKTKTDRTRPLADRIGGARRLLRWQGCCLIVQFFGWLLAVLLVIQPF